MTGLKLVLTTDVNVGDIQQDLREIYKVSPSNHKAVAVAKEARILAYEHRCACAS